FGEYDTFASQVTLTAGAWPTESTASTLTVAIPEAAARSLGLVVGSQFPVTYGSKSVTVQVAGVYKPNDAHDDYWLHDLLDGRGDAPQFGRPGASLAPPIEAIGPLIGPAGAIDAAHLPVATLDLQYQPSFTSVTVGELVPLGERVASAEDDIPSDAAAAGGTIYVTTRLASSIGAVASGLIVTRSTVVVVALLLGVLAVAAMAQTAKLFTDVRAGERRMLRARGASGRRLLALGLVEAIAIGAVTAAVSPPVAVLIYAALAAQAPMRAAGMPAVVTASPAAWLTAAAVALLLVMVLIAPLVLRAGELVDAERARRQPRSVVARSGLDVAIVAIAAVAFWQLRSYRSPVAASGSLSVDPVLAAGPAIALLACALVCVRLIPLAARALERIGEGGKGALAALVGWEIGRRTRRATATVLALSLALAVSTFALSFLATWRQSQIDQATVAIGPPVRIAADTEMPFVQSGTLTAPGAAVPQPAIHRLTRVIPFDSARDDTANGIPARVLGLTAAARSMLDSGRLSDIGGADIARDIRDSDVASGIDLGANVAAIGATATVSAPGLGGGAVMATVTAIIQNDAGLLGTVDLGHFAVDGEPHDLTAALTGTGSPKPVAGSLSLAGIRVSLAGTDADDARAAEVAEHVTVTNLAVTRGGVTAAVALPADPGWSPVQAGSAHKAITVLPGLAFDAVVPAGLVLEPAIYALVSWKPLDVISAVVPADFAKDFTIEAGARTALLLNGDAIPISVDGRATLVPGSALLTELGSTGSIVGAEPVPNIVVDESSLARLLMQKGYRGALADEWWIDVAPDHAAQYVRDHPGAVSSEVAAQGLLQAPLRVATQAALWLALVSGGVLAAICFAVQTAATMRERRLEFAQLQAVGLGRGGLTASVALESALLVALGSLFGVGIGLLLAWFVGPLVTVSADGTPPVPSVIVETPWVGVAILVGAMSVALLGIVAVVAGSYRAMRPAELLRAGGD
ncbi:MAG: ABC transporter permease, partial [Rhodoglobus sp.]